MKTQLCAAIVLGILSSNANAEELVAKLRVIATASASYAIANSTPVVGTVMGNPLSIPPNPSEGIKNILEQNKATGTFNVYTTSEVYNKSEIDNLVTSSINTAEENITLKLSEIAPNFYIELRAEMMRLIKEEIKIEIRNDILKELCPAFDEGQKPDTCN